jgi:hypothetical protein
LVDQDKLLIAAFCVGLQALGVVVATGTLAPE